VAIILTAMASMGQSLSHKTALSQIALKVGSSLAAMRQS
jgi:hypothetical protein